jgi:2-oxoglutarate dehydrogenase E2 component (dihydrolipoamide succinyltransferase)
VLASIKVAEDETVDVGAELAVIEDSASGASAAATETSAPVSEPAAESSPPAEPATTEQQTSPAEPAPAEESAEPAAAPPPPPGPAAPTAPAAANAPAASATGDEDEGEAGGGPSYVTPLVRRLAAEHGVDLAEVTGTGVGGRIRKQDVLDAAAKSGGRGAATPAAASTTAAPAVSTGAAVPAAAPSRAAAPASAPPAEARPGRSLESPMRGTTEKLSRLRQVIAERMTESLRISAQLTTVVEVDLTRIARLRDRAKADFEAREGVKLTFLPFFAIATCEALREHPAVNSSIDLEAGTVTYHDTVHLGVAVDTPRGLLVPVLKEASDLNLAGIARKVDDLATRTRNNHITPDELGGGTFTITNTGSRGALFDTPIINQPQVGILGTGAVVKRPVVIDDPVAGEVIAVRHIAYFSLTYDHRMVDGADAARFLATVKQRLEDGEFEAELGL